MQTVEIARHILKQQRRRTRLTSVGALLEKFGVSVGVAPFDAHARIPIVGNACKIRVEHRTQAADQVGQRIFEVAVLALADLQQPRWPPVEAPINPNPNIPESLIEDMADGGNDGDLMEWAALMEWAHRRLALAPVVESSTHTVVRPTSTSPRQADRLATLVQFRVTAQVG